MLGHTRCCARFGPTSFSAAASRDFIDDATCSAGPTTGAWRVVLSGAGTADRQQPRPASRAPGRARARGSGEGQQLASLRP